MIIIKNKLNKKFLLSKILFLNSIIIFGLYSCNDQPLFDELYENRILLYMKGTYSSNGTKDFSAYAADMSANPDCKDDSVTLPDSEGDRSHLLANLGSVRLDLAQIGVIKSSKGDFDIDEDDVQKLSDYRQLFNFKFMENPTFTPGEVYNKFDLEDPSLTDSEKNDKIAKSITHNNAFFNDSGYGVLLESDDVKSGFYNKFRIFVRKIISGNAQAFLLNTEGAIIGYVDPVTASYDNDRVDGFELSQMYRFRENDINSSTENYLFPYTLTKSFEIPKEGPLHFEIRIFLKNNMKVYETTNMIYSDNNFTLIAPLETPGVAVRFWAFSDFHTNFASDSETMKDNFMMAIHLYNPETVGSIYGTVNPTYLNGDDLRGDTYVAVVPAGSPAPINYVPDMATGKAVSGVYTVMNVPPGVYDVYLMQDVGSLGDGQENRRDGFPELVAGGLITNPIPNIIVPEKQNVPANLE